jgi:adenylate cyclase
MPEPGVQRRLAAILAADVAGYSRLMGNDEAGTAKALRGHAEALRPIIAGHGGRIVDTAGDGVLLEFPSIVAAVECAVAAQKLMAERNADVPQDRRMLYRIGINLGDVIVEGERILGDGVNVAARLESIAAPGGICLSDAAYQQVRDKVSFEVEDAGDQVLKNIVRPIRVYHIVVDSRQRRAVSRSHEGLALPDKPSIAVLPFQNLSGDPEQEYFADGMVEEIIIALSRFRQLFVIARNSSFTYKGRAVDVKQIGRDLGVRYVLEGSVRKTASRVRITGQLVGALTGVHLWADRFEGTLEDIFDLQDRVTGSVVGAVAPTLEKAEIERAKRKPTESLTAHDYFMRGMASYNHGYANRGSNAEALRLFKRAGDIDPDFAVAYAMAALCYSHRRAGGWMSDQTNEIAEATKLAKRAAELGTDDARALCAAGVAMAYLGRDLDTGADLIDRALVLNPNLVAAWWYGGLVKMWLGEPDAAIERFARAMRLSPIDPAMPRMQSSTANAHFYAGRYDEASSWAAMALRLAPDFHDGLRIAAASNALAGRLEVAHKAIARVLQLHPTLRISNLSEVQGPYRRPEDIARYEEGLRQAGLPE